MKTLPTDAVFPPVFFRSRNQTESSACGENIEGSGFPKMRRRANKESDPVSHQGAGGMEPFFNISGVISPFLSLRRRRSWFDLAIGWTGPLRSRPQQTHPLTISYWR
jgi:hypothetical protein